MASRSKSPASRNRWPCRSRRTLASDTLHPVQRSPAPGEHWQASCHVPGWSCWGIPKFDSFLTILGLGTFAAEQLMPLQAISCTHRGSLPNRHVAYNPLILPRLTCLTLLAILSLRCGLDRPSSQNDTIALCYASFSLSVGNYVRGSNDATSLSE